MKILVTGNKGFVGKETEKVLKEAGHEVHGYDLMDGYDVRDQGQLESELIERDIDRIIHLAAIARFSEADENPILAWETNAYGTYNVAQIADRYHIPVVYASTGSVYMPIEQEPPITEDFPVKGNSNYACSKALGEEYIKQLANPYLILRLAHLYGPEKRYHGLVGGFLQRINKGMAPVLYNGTQSNDFLYIKDVARALKLAVEASWDKWNRAINIGSGEELSAKEAGEMICDVFGYEGKIDKQEARSVDPSRFIFDTKTAEKYLGFKAEYNFRDGLLDMAKEQGYNLRDGLQGPGKKERISKELSLCHY